MQDCRWIVTPVLMNFLSEILNVKNNIGGMRV